MKTAYVIDIDATSYDNQYFEINYPAEVYETEAEALAALEAYDINNCCDCIVNGDADDILKVWVSVARCDYNPEDIDGELDACALLSEAEKPPMCTRRSSCLALTRSGTMTIAEMNAASGLTPLPMPKSRRAKARL